MQLVFCSSIAVSLCRLALQVESQKWVVVVVVEDRSLLVDLAVFLFLFSYTTCTIVFYKQVNM